MNIRDKLYKKDNITVSKSINIDDSLYEKIRQAIEKKYDASISDIINVALEEYIEKMNLNFMLNQKWRV